MESWLPLVVSIPFIVLLLASGAWTERRYARFDKLPSHFNIRGVADAFASRRVMAWLLPLSFSVLLIVIALAGMLVPPHLRNGDPAIGALVGGACLLGAQVFVLWLTERWARRQDTSD